MRIETIEPEKIYARVREDSRENSIWSIFLVISSHPGQNRVINGPIFTGTQAEVEAEAERRILNFSDLVPIEFEVHL